MTSSRRTRLSLGQDDTSFRRSRTLTGSQSSNVRSANEERGALQSERLKKQSLQRRRRVILSGLAMLFVAIGGLYYLLSQYIGSVNTINFLPQTLTQQPSSQGYAATIMSFLRARPAERFRFALDDSELSQYVAQKYPEVSSVTRNGGGMGFGNFIITLRQPTVTWQVGTHQYYVDNQGVSFEKNYGPAPSVSVVDDSGASLSHGSALVSKDFLHFIGRLVALTDQSGLGNVTQATLPPGTTREIDITIQGRGFFIKTDSDRDPATEVQDMKLVVAYLDQHKLSPSYIDLRVVGRAFYK